MRFIGFFAAVGIAVLGAGYFFFVMPSGEITLENKQIPQILMNQAPDNGQQSTENGSQQMTDNGQQTAESKDQEPMSSEQTTNNRQQITDSKEQSADNRQQAAEEKANEDMKIISKKVNFGFGVPSKPRTIDTIVLHSSYDPEGSDPYSVEKVISIWRGYEVAPHYMIDRKGNIYRLVDDANIAYHAGVSKMSDGRTNVNDFSIGIEILNTKDDKYTSAQYDAVNDLIASLKEKYPIKNVVGHDDIAPGRKTDPWHFDWKKLKQ